MPVVTSNGQSVLDQQSKSKYKAEMGRCQHYL